MTEEQLNKANGIFDEIKKVELEIEYWTIAPGYAKKNATAYGLTLERNTIKQGRYVTLEPFLTFEELRTRALSYYKKKLSDLQERFLKV